MTQKRLARAGLLLLLAALAPACGGGGGGKKKGGPPTPGVVQFVSSAVSINEGTTGTQTVTLKVRRTGGTGAVTVQFATSDGTGNHATAGADYTAQTGTLSWAAGDNADKNIVIAIADQDGIVEGIESFLVTLSSPVNASLGANKVCTVSIGDLDAPPDGVFVFSAPVYTIVEGSGSTVQVTITVQRSGGTAVGAVSVDVVVSAGSATAGADYTVPGVAGTVTLNWADGDSTDKTFTIDILADGLDAAGTETINLALNNAQPAGGPDISPTLNTAVVNIIDRQAPGEVQFDAASYSVSEAGVSIDIHVQRINGAGGAASVDVALGGGTTTAVAGTDYTDPGAITLNWADGDIADQVFTLQIIDNLVIDGNRLLELLLQNAVNVTITTATNPNPVVLTITDDEGGTLVFSSATYSVAEGNAGTSTVTITVNRIGASATSVASVEVLVSDGTATVAGLDYVAPATNPVPLNFAAGVTSQTFDITINGDTTFEANETILLALQNPVGSNIGAPGTATVTITNDDEPPGGVIVLSSATYSVVEGTGGANSVTITVNRSGSQVGANAASCKLRTANITAKGNGKNKDYTSTNVTVNFAAGEVTKDVLIPITTDGVKEPNETFRVTINTPSANALIGTPASATVTITNDD